VSLVARGSHGALESLQALRTLDALGPLGSLRSLGTLNALNALNALGPLRSNIALWARMAPGSLRRVLGRMSKSRHGNATRQCI
jgi:hypothetical protein